MIRESDVSIWVTYSNSKQIPWIIKRMRDNVNGMKTAPGEDEPNLADKAEEPILEQNAVE